MKKAIGGIAAAALLAMACGGGTGSGSLDGTASFGVGSAMTLTVALPDGGASLQGATLFMVNSGMSCDDLRALEKGQTGSNLPTSILEANLLGSQVGPGTYPLAQDPPSDGGTFVMLHSQVFAQEGFEAAAGTFTVEKLDATGMKGSFDATGDTNNPGELKGSFDAPNCTLSQ